MRWFSRKPAVKSKLWEVNAGVQIHGLRLSQDGGRAIGADQHGGKVYCWDRNGQLRWAHEVAAQADKRTDRYVASLSVTEDASLVAIGSHVEEEGLVTLLDGFGNTAWESEQSERVFEVCLSANGKFLAASVEGEGITLFDQGGHRLWQYPIDEASPRISFSKQSSMLLASPPHEVEQRAKSCGLDGFPGFSMWGFCMSRVVFILLPLALPF